MWVQASGIGFDEEDVMKTGVVLIKIYRAVWHPIYRGAADAGFPLVHCSLEPSCSEYALQVFEKEPFPRALRMVWKRLLLCHRTRKKQMKGDG